MPITDRLLLPPPLAPGDLIGVAAPAGPFDLDRFRAGLARLESLGYATRCPEQIFERNGFLAGSDDRRIETLNDLLRDDDVKAVIGARGGYGSMRILDRLDLTPLRTRPKILMGFSDLTALLLAVHRSLGLITFHGPVVTSLSDADDETVEHLSRLLSGRQAFPLSLQETLTLHPGRAEGPLIGGNLTLLLHLLPTAVLPDLDGAILFIEDVSEAPYRMDRMLTTLKMSGILERCAGVIVGRCENCGSEGDLLPLFEDALAHVSGPAIVNFPIGHGTRNFVLPIGPRALLDTDAGVLDIVEPFLD